MILVMNHELECFKHFTKQTIRNTLIPDISNKEVNLQGKKINKCLESRQVFIIIV